MKRAILLAVLSALVISIPAFAADPSQKKEFDIEKRREEVISRIDKRIGMLQELKKCVTDAKTREELKKCRGSFKEERRELWEEMRHEKK